MQDKFLQNNWVLFFLLTFVAALVHYPSLNLSLYGDDWLVIYLYQVRELDPARFGPLPGIFSFLTPYGLSILLMGVMYDLFETRHYLYFVTSLIFRIFSSYSLFLVCQRITRDKFVSFLSACLFLVGFTGIQTTDWVFYMNVYFAVGIFLSSLYFSIKFLQGAKNKDLASSLFLSIAAIIIAPVRLYPLVVIIPFIDLIIFLSQKCRCSLHQILFKNSFFVTSIILFWLIGLFGSPKKIYSPDAWSIRDFFEFIFKYPLQSINSFFHWIGVIVIPDHLSLTLFKPQIIGILFSFLLIMVLFRVKKNTDNIKGWLIVLGLTFFIFLTGMWFFSRMRIISSSDRYLSAVFASFCLLAGVLVTATGKLSSIRLSDYLKFSSILVLIFLIGLHIVATRSIYAYWLSKGRDVNFIQTVDREILDDFPSPITRQSIIYLDFDDGAILQSVQFGLALKILVLTRTQNQQYLASVYNEKPNLVKAVKARISQGNSTDSVVSSIHAYQLKSGSFTDITSITRKEMLSLMKNDGSK